MLHLRKQFWVLLLRLKILVSCVLVKVLRSSDSCLASTPVMRAWEPSWLQILTICLKPTFCLLILSFTSSYIKSNAHGFKETFTPNNTLYELSLYFILWLLFFVKHYMFWYFRFISCNSDSSEFLFSHQPVYAGSVFVVTTQTNTTYLKYQHMNANV